MDPRARDEQHPGSEPARATRDPLFARAGAVWMLVLLALFVANMLWSNVERAPGIDFFQFWAVGQAVEQKLVDDVYAPAARPRLAAVFLERAQQSTSERLRAAASFRKKQIQAASAPFLYTCFHAFQSGDYDRDLTHYRLLALACAVASVVALALLVGLFASEIWILLAWMCTYFAALNADLAEGNVNSIQVMLLSAYICLQRGRERFWKSACGGAVLGIALAFKPNIALVLVLLGGFWLITRNHRKLLHAALGLCAGLTFAVASASLFFGSLGCWRAWLALLRELDVQMDVGVTWGNFALARLLRDATGFDWSLVLTLAALGSIALVVFRGRARRVDRTATAVDERRALRSEMLLVGLGPVIALFASNLAWPHYLVLALPLWVCVLAARDPSVPARSWPRTTLLVLIVAGLSSTVLLAALPAVDVRVRALVTGAPAVLLFALGLWELGRNMRATKSA